MPLAVMAMNFVTFNQDYSQLAVGECELLLCRVDTETYRYLSRLQAICYRAVRKNL